MDSEPVLASVILTSVMGVVVPAMVYTSPGAAKTAKRVCVALGVASLLSFLWLPWAAYGVSTVWKLNMALINDKPIPTTVLPPTPVQRPSVQDKPLENTP